MFKRKVNGFSTKEEAHAYIESEGYFFSMDEIKECLLDCSECQELSDQQLELVSGGRGCVGANQCHLPSICGKAGKGGVAPACPIFIYARKK